MRPPRVVQVIALMALAVGCAPTGTAPTTSPVATPTATTVPIASAGPATPTARVVDPTPSSSPAATPTAAPGEPPMAFLGDDTTEVEGELRTYCWLDGCADAFELPPRDDLPILSVDVSVTELGFHLAGDTPYFNWTASYGAGSMGDLMPLDEGGESFDPDTTATPPPVLTESTIATPPAGSWIVYIVIRATEGDAHYAWHVVVP